MTDAAKGTRTQVAYDKGQGFPRWVMTMCTACGGVILASSPSAHPSFPLCTCEVKPPA